MREIEHETSASYAPKEMAVSRKCGHSGWNNKMRCMLDNARLGKEY